MNIKNVSGKVWLRVSVSALIFAAAAPAQEHAEDKSTGKAATVAEAKAFVDDAEARLLRFFDEIAGS